MTIEATHASDKNEPDGTSWSPILGALILGGAVVLIGLAFASEPGWPNGFARATAGFFLSGTCLLLGALIGFLFGIPRYLQSGSASEPDQSNDSRAAEAKPISAATRQPRYSANTNLEQISDWLTKILVGVGLTQIGAIPSILERAGLYFGSAIAAEPFGKPLAVVIILYFLVCGLLFGYLWTRLFLAGELSKVERGLAQAVEQVSAAASALAEKVNVFEEARQQQAQIDANAISLATQYLNPQTEPLKVDVGALKDAVQGASAPVKVQIFYQARDLRSRSWRRASDKPLVERTIPIFEALIAADVEKRFHQNHAQLGYALKDRRNPDFAAAEARLTTAIEIRGPASENGWELYEFNRAVCRIKQDAGFRNGEASSTEAVKLIRDDLQVVARVLKDEIAGDPDIVRWLQLNKLAVDTL